ncbi:MAG TPA: VOC family protein [Dongiaceae bacterium]|jgi:catechol 2,3-dioxygenase-like lactoylglutathione lyase family enzyme|nr:VOC family protein [Dongiaceae bacterium]
MITGFNHTSFTVADMDKSVKFWTEMLGFEAASVSPREGRWQEEATGIPGASLMVAHLYGHGHHIEFIQYLAGAIPGAAPQPALRGAAHVCLETDDIERTWAALLKAGATAQGAIATVTTGAVGGARAGYIRDPNGILIELLQLAPA